MRGHDVAVVGNVHVSKAAYAALLGRAQTALAGQHLGSSLSSALLTDAVMRRLVSDAEQQDAARRRGTNAQAVRAAIERRARVTAADNASFVGFLGPGPPAARETRSIVVADQALAERLYVRLSVGDGATWCALAKYSLDHGSRDRCGTALITNGMLVQPLDRIVFSAPEDKTLLIRVGDGYWTILELLSGVDRTEARFQVKQMLLIQRKAIMVGEAETTTSRGYCTGVNVSYRHGYQPTPDPTHCNAARQRATRAN